MEANEIVAFLCSGCGYIDDAEEIVDKIQSIRTFKEAELLTRDQGLLIQMQDDREFRIMAVRSN